MKILVIAGFAPSLLNFRKEMLLGFIKKGHTVWAAAPDNNMEVANVLRKHAIEYIHIPLNPTGINPLQDLYSVLKMAILIKKLSPNIVLAYTIKPVIYSLLAMTASQKCEKYALITGLGFSFGNKSIKQKVISHIPRYLLRISLRRATKIFFQNPDDMALFQREKLVPKTKPVAIINGSGVNLDHFSFVPLKSTIPFRFLLIARLLRDKGIYEYVGAAKKIKLEFPTVQFDLVGPEYPSPNAIKKEELNRWIAEKTINYHGSTADVRPYLQNCHVFVLPSYREGTPRSVLEAMAVGRAIITTDAPGCRETVIDGENGFMVRPADIDDLARAMLRIYLDKTLPSRMGAASREIVERKYDVRKVNNFLFKEMGL